MGAANVFREMCAKVGVLVGILDAGKGALAIYIAQVTDMPQIAVLLAGVAAVIGHNWTIFLSFKGGRGESTTIGVLLIKVTQPMLIVAGLTIVILLISKNVPLASIALFIPLPLVCWWLEVPGVLIAYSISLPCIVGFTHFIRTKRFADTSGEDNA